MTHTHIHIHIQIHHIAYAKIEYLFIKISRARKPTAAINNVKARFCDWNVLFVPVPQN